MLVLCEGHRSRMLKRGLGGRVAAPQQTRIGMKFSVYGWGSKVRWQNFMRRERQNLTAVKHLHVLTEGFCEVNERCSMIPLYLCSVTK